VHRPDVEVGDQLVQVLGRGRAVVPAGPVVRVAEAAQVDGEDPVVRREQRDEPVEGPPGLGEAVDQQDRRSAGARGDVVQLGSVGLGAVVGDHDSLLNSTAWLSKYRHPDCRSSSAVS